MAKEMTGVLFKNDKRETDKHPLYKGQCMINGQEFWIAAWINEHEERVKYMSLKFTPKEETTISPARSSRRNEDGDIPF